jgi:hypothetical protein
MWMYHNAAGHDAWKSRQSTKDEPSTGKGTFSSGPKTAKTTPIASLVVPFHDSDSDDDENGWTPVRI